MQDVAIGSQTSSRNFILIAGLLLYCGAFAILLGNPSFEAAAGVVVLVVFGIVLPLIAWLTTRRAVPLSIFIRSGAPQLIVLIGYVAAVSLYLIGGPQWIDQHKICSRSCWCTLPAISCRTSAVSYEPGFDSAWRSRLLRKVLQ
jgi:hypothetical protein